MEQLSRHQCLIYDGAPSRHLPMLARVMRQKLNQGYRCMFLDSAPMVLGMRSHLAAAGVDTISEVANGRLVMSSERNYLIGGRRFDVDRMLQALAGAVQGALGGGFEGLWASGNIGWELGPERDFSQLLEYEWQLDGFIRENPGLQGICQYHRDTLPREAVVDGVLSHSSLVVDEARSLINPHACSRELFRKDSKDNPHFEPFVQGVCRMMPEIPEAMLVAVGD
jgi:hypothetical protein